jgi:RimJ/RimL family protein N-acetyltransferase
MIEASRSDAYPAAACRVDAARMEGGTERLLLRPLTLADAPAMQEHFPHWEIVRYLLAAVPWPYPPDGARRFCRDTALPAMEQGEAWHWTLRLRSAPGAAIGMVSLFRRGEDQRGLWLGLPWQRQGLMTEAAAWANDVWFDTLGFDHLRVGKARANTASRRLSQRQGMRLVATGERNFVCGTLDAETWELTAAEWRAWRAKHPPRPA